MKELNEVKQAIKYLELDAKEQADNFSASMIVSTKTILAIAEAFRALEQRAEAAEAKLAELEKQEPVAYTDAEEIETMRKVTYADMFTPCVAYKSDPQWIPLFTRPAPAADLAGLVPDKWYFQLTFDIPNLENMTPYQAHGAAWEQCRAAILRNIEEANK